MRHGVSDYEKEIRDAKTAVKNLYIGTFMSLDDKEIRKFDYDDIQQIPEEPPIYVSYSSPYETRNKNGKKMYYRFLIRKRPLVISLNVSFYKEARLNELRKGIRTIELYRNVFYPFKKKDKLDDKVLTVSGISKVTKKRKEIEDIPTDGRLTKLSALKRKIAKRHE